MDAKDRRLIADTLRYCDGHTDNEEEAALVAWVAEKLADAIQRQHPKFDRRAFMRDAIIRQS